MNDMTWIIAVDDRRLGGLLSAARAVSGTVEAVVVGTPELAQAVAKTGVDKVTLFEVPEDIPAEALAQSVAQAAKEADIRLAISNDAISARMILGAIAGSLKAAVVGGVIDVVAEGGAVVARKTVANGKAVESVKADGPMAAIFIGPDVDPAGGDAEIVVASAEATSDRVVGFEQEQGTGLASARRVVGVGMGVASRDNLPMMEEFAQALGAEIACTLPACDDMRWYPPERVLGSSHHSTAPDLYIAVGISGNPNHISGVRDASCIVGINNDENAGIFNYSKFGIVGDLNKVVPALTAALK